MSNVLGPTTLVPLSAIAAVFASAFWISGLAKDVQALGAEVTRLKSNQDTIEAEIIQQLKSQAITLQEVQIQAAKSETKLSTLIALIRRMEQEEKNH